jgi:hypothetical protein
MMLLAVRYPMSKHPGRKANQTGHHVVRKEHVVPRQHYARFAHDSRGHVHCLEKPTGAIRVADVEKLYFKDFYNFFYQGELRDDFETMLNDLEARVPAVFQHIDSLVAGDKLELSERDREALSIYLAALHLRSHATRRWALDDLSAKATRGAAIRLAMAGPKYWTLARALADGRYRVRPEGQAALTVFRHFDGITNWIFQEHWVLAVRPRAPFYVLGDAPAQGLVTLDDRKHLRVPVSPERALIVGLGSTEGVVFDMSDGDIAAVNRLAFDGSTHHVVSRSTAELKALRPSLPAQRAGPGSGQEL